VDPEETAALLRQHLRLAQTAQVAVEAKLLTDTTLDRISLQGLHAHVASVFRPERWPPLAPRLHLPVEHTVYLLFGIRDEAEPTIPDEMADADKEALLAGLRAQCADLATAPHLLETPAYAAYALFDAKNAVGLQRLADETIAVWRESPRARRGKGLGAAATPGGHGRHGSRWAGLTATVGWEEGRAGCRARDWS